LIEDQRFIKILNLVRTQPRFSVRESDAGDLFCESVNPVPENRGFYWIAGVTHLQNGIDIESVFVVDTDSGAEQSNVFWYVKGAWYEHRESESAAEALGIAKADMFPYDWTYHVPVTGDIHSNS